MIDLKNISTVKEDLDQYEVDTAYTRGALDDPVAILEIAREQGCDWIITAGYGSGTIRGIMFGEVLDELLRKTDLPILISR